MRKEYTQAIKLLKEIIKSYKYPPPRTYENLGRIYMEMGKEEEALVYWRKEIKIYPQISSTYAMIGLYWLNNNQIEKAEKYFHKALNLEPDFYLSYYGLGEIAYIREDLNSAFAFYKKSILLNFQFAEAHYGLGKVYAKKGSFQAIREFLLAIRLKPDFASAYNDLAICYASLNPPNWHLAKEYVSKAKELGFPVKESFLKLIYKHSKKYNKN
jgi:tetratricopeptide (TPR) repeat protein